MTDKLKTLYDAVSGDYDVGTYDDFVINIHDPEKRQSLYKTVSRRYDIGDTFNDFEGQIETTLQRAGPETQLSTPEPPTMLAQQAPIQAGMGAVASSTGVAQMGKIHEDYQTGQIVPQEERGFVENMQESFKRGMKSADIDIMMYDASMGTKNYDEVKEIRDKYEKMAQEDPLKADNFLSKAMHSVAAMAGPMAQGTLEGFTAGVTLAGIAAAAGQAGPQFLTPEEIFTIPGGFGLGAMLGAGQYWYRQGTGAMYGAIRDAGVSDDIARIVSHPAGVLYAAIEFSQVGKIIPGLKQAAKEVIAGTVKQAVGRMAAKYGANWATEVGEEALQEVVQIIAEEGSKYLSNFFKDTKLETKDLTENLERVGNVIEEVALPMALMLAPGAISETTTLSKGGGGTFGEAGIVRDEQGNIVALEPEEEVTPSEPAVKAAQPEEVKPPEEKAPEPVIKPEEIKATIGVEGEVKPKEPVIKPKEEVKPKPEKPAEKPGIKDVKTFKQEMKTKFKLSDEQAAAVSEITEARAEKWAESTGRPKEEWYSSHIAEIREGKAENVKGDRLLAQAAEEGKVPEFKPEHTSRDAINFGLKAQDKPELIKELKRKQEEYAKMWEEKFNSRDIDGAMEASFLSQLYREAHEVATGKGGAADYAKSEKLYQEAAPMFYSKMERTLEEKMPSRSNPVQIRGILNKAGIKQEEIEFYDFDNFLKENERVISKQQVMDFVRDRQVKVDKIDGVKYTEETKNDIYKLYEKGMPSTEISKITEIGETTILRWLRDKGIIRTPAETKGITEDVKKQVLRKYEDGNSIQSVADRLNIGTSTVHRILKANNKNRALKDVRDLPDNVKKEIKRLYLGEELNSYEIGESLGISPSTVRKNAKKEGYARTASEAQALRASLGRLKTYGIKANTHGIHVDSFYELARVQQLNNDESVEKVERSSDRIKLLNGKYYNPDIKVTYNDGSVVVEEIKPRYQLDQSATLEKQSAAVDYYKDKNVEYKIVSENDIGINGFKNIDLSEIENLSKEDKARIQKSKNTAISFLKNYQPLFQKAQGAVEFLQDGRAIVHAFEISNVSTAVHELAHIFRRDLNTKDMQTVLEWADEKTWTRKAEEKFARGFERYLQTGQAPTAKLKAVFEKFKAWISEIYGRIKGSAIDVKLTPKMKDVFNRMLGGEVKETKAAKTKAAPKTVRQWVAQRGRIKPEHLAEHGINQREEAGIKLQVGAAKGQGVGLDDLGATAIREGVIDKNPEGMLPGEWLLKNIRDNAKLAEIATEGIEKEYDRAQLEEIYKKARNEGAIPDDMELDEFQVTIGAGEALFQEEEGAEVKPEYEKKYVNEMAKKGIDVTKLKTIVQKFKDKELLKQKLTKEEAKGQEDLFAQAEKKKQTTLFQETLKFETDNEAEENISKVWEKVKDVWFGNKDVRVLSAHSEKRRFQRRIKEYTGAKRYGETEKDLDRAIQIYIDTKRHPEVVQDREIMDKLTDEQRRIVDLSRRLPTEIKQIADEMSESYQTLGMEALDAGVIRNVLDNYAGRIWDIEKKTPTEIHRLFGTTTRHAKQRRIMTIIEGQALGLELKVAGGTNNLEVLKTEIVRTIEDKNFIKTLRKIKTIDGEPLLTTRMGEGRVLIKHPNFTYWGFAGKIEEGKTYGRNFIQDEEGNLFEKRQLYAPKKQADNLNNILGISSLMEIPGLPGDIIKTTTKYNAIIKSWILQSSFFHHLAFMRSYYFGTTGKTLKEMNIRQSYRDGVRMIEEEAPIIQHLVKNGLTLGVKQDWSEELVREATFVGNILDRTGATKAIKDKINELRDRQADFLFGEFGAGLKAKSAIIEYRNLLKKHPDIDIDEAAKMAAALINDDFGGLHLQRLGRNPTLQHIFRLLALAPDWTESNVRTMVKMFKHGDEGKLYRKFWAGVITRGLGLTVIGNLLMASWDEDDEEARGAWERFVRNYKRAYEQGGLKYLDVDITPLYKALGGTTRRRKYFGIMGHFKDPIKFIIGQNTKGGWPDPIKSLATSAKHKGSVIFKTIFEALVGTDWAGRRFTTIQELLGVDTEKGVYKTTSKKYGYKKGDPKYGKLAGETVTWDYQKQGLIGMEQVPSYILSQIKGSQPVQIQYLIARLNGEIETFDAIANSMGLGVKTTYEKE